MGGGFVLLGLALVRLVVRVGERRALADRLRAPAPVRSLQAPPPIRRALHDAASPVDADRVWTAWCATTAVVLVLGITAGGIGLAMVVVTAAVGAPLLVLAATRDRSLRLVDAALPDTLDAVARSLRSGAVLHEAVAEAAEASPGRLREDLRRAVDETGDGVPLVAALEAWAARCPTAGVRLAVAALALSAEAGGAAARAVDGVAETLRANLAVQGEVRAQSSQARMSALVIAAAPLAFGALAAGTDGRTAAFLLRTPVGLSCLAAGLALDGVAAWWMHRVTAVPV